MSSSTKELDVSFTLNGQATKVKALPMARLLDVLREDVKLTGTKEGCGEGECGACSIWLDGELVNSCLVPFVQVAGREVVTIEGMAKGGELHPVQRAFIRCGGAQCGICTPGMIMAAAHLLQHNKKPTLDDIKEGLAGNLCRCTGYTKIFDSVAAAADDMAAAEAAGAA